jgi:hypothetical protein
VDQTNRKGTGIQEIRRPSGGRERENRIQKEKHFGGPQTCGAAGPRLFIEVYILHQHRLVAKTAKIERRHFGLLLAVFDAARGGGWGAKLGSPETVQRGQKQRRRRLKTAAFVPATCIFVCKVVRVGS